jgi:hypothetical protein
MKRILAVSLPVLAAAALAAAPAHAQAKDPVLGTWVLNVAKSSYTPGPAPKSQTRTYTASGNMISFVATGVGADDKPTKAGFTAAYDGKDYALTGNPMADMIAITRIDANTGHAVLKKGGKEVATAHRVISADGKTMTLTTTGTDAKGAKVKNVEVFDRK